MHPDQDCRAIPGAEREYQMTETMADDRRAATPSPADLSMMPPAELRRAARAGRFTAATTTASRGYVQANLAILPRDYAEEFLLFCQRNPRACPLIGLSDPGSPRLPDLGADIDLRSDLPSYRVFRDGAFVEDRPDVGELWRDDFVAFALGCSLSFEEALGSAGVAQSYLDHDRIVPTYLTNIECRPAGRFSGNLVVSMRQFSPRDAIRAIQVTTRFPNVHGAPVHIGDPALIGIADLAEPYFGTPPDIALGQLPLFWACGVTPQLALAVARPPVAITHTPAHMLVTDRRNADFAVL